MGCGASKSPDAELASKYSVEQPVQQPGVVSAPASAVPAAAAAAAAPAIAEPVQFSSPVEAAIPSPDTVTAHGWQLETAPEAKAAIKADSMKTHYVAPAQVAAMPAVRCTSAVSTDINVPIDSDFLPELTIAPRDDGLINLLLALPPLPEPAPLATSASCTAGINEPLDGDFLPELKITPGDDGLITLLLDIPLLADETAPPPAEPKLPAAEATLPAAEATLPAAEATPPAAEQTATPAEPVKLVAAAAVPVMVALEASSTPPRKFATGLSITAQADGLAKLSIACSDLVEAIGGGAVGAAA